MSSLLISSPSNQIIKDLVKLKSRKGDRACRSFIVEGAREIERALGQGFFLEDFFVCPALMTEQTTVSIDKLAKARTTTLSKEAFSKVATRESTDGVLGVFTHREFTFDDILKRAGQNAPFVLVLENLEKPGNLGAILRTADGCGVHGVVILGKNIDLWNPNVIRSSLGGVFSVPALYCPDQELFFAWCARNSIKLVAAVLSAESAPIYDEKLSGPIAVALGSEAQGLSQSLLAKIDRPVIIPMQGICDSLNVSVAGGIFMYEVLRQRHQR